jgi:integrase
VNLVQPIRDKTQISRMVNLAQRHDRQCGGVSWELLLSVGMNTGLRISDILELRVGDILSGAAIRPKKTRGRSSTRVFFQLDAATERRVRVLLSGRDPQEFAFASRQKDKYTGEKKAISRQRAYQIMRELGSAAGVSVPIGTHSLRKTYGYWDYQAFRDPETLRKELGHKNIASTLHYIGINEDSMREHQLRRESLTARP